MAEQRTFNPRVEGSSPLRPTYDIHVGGQWQPNEPGEIVFHSEDGKVRIVQADPRIWITDELMFLWYIRPEYKIDRHFRITFVHDGIPRMPVIEYMRGTILTFADDYEAKFIYVIKEYDFPKMLWLAEWPD